MIRDSFGPFDGSRHMGYRISVGHSRSELVIGIKGQPLVLVFANSFPRAFYLLGPATDYDCNLQVCHPAPPNFFSGHIAP